MILTNMIYSEKPYIYGVLLISCFYVKQVISTNIERALDNVKQTFCASMNRFNRSNRIKISYKILSYTQIKERFR